MSDYREKVLAPLTLGTEDEDAVLTALGRCLTCGEPTDVCECGAPVGEQSLSRNDGGQDEVAVGLGRDELVDRRAEAEAAMPKPMRSGCLEAGRRLAEQPEPAAP